MSIKYLMPVFFIFLCCSSGNSGEEQLCENLCGDGLCQEIVCLGEGCPCPETSENCSEDCVSEVAKRN